MHQDDTPVGAHTPGPWQGKESLFSDYETEIRPEWAGQDSPKQSFRSLRCIATVKHDKRLPVEQYMANAQPIASEPELLASLEFAVKLLSAMPLIAGAAQIDAMRAAIANGNGGAA